jgi:hypothetical protein
MLPLVIWSIQRILNAVVRSQHSNWKGIGEFGRRGRERERRGCDLMRPRLQGGIN